MNLDELSKKLNRIIFQLTNIYEQIKWERIGNIVLELKGILDEIEEEKKKESYGI